MESDAEKLFIRKMWPIFVYTLQNKYTLHMVGIYDDLKMARAIKKRMERGMSVEYAIVKLQVLEQVS